MAVGERAVVTQANQIGVESTPGTLVAANKLLSSIGIALGVQASFNRFRPQGQKFASQLIPGREWAAGQVAGAGSYTELPYLFAMMSTPQTIVQQGATTAYLHPYEMKPKAEDDVKTLTVEQGGAVRAHRAGYGLLPDLGISISREAV